MRRKILVQARYYVTCTALGVTVECGNDSRYILPCHWLVVRVKVGPNRRAGLRVAQFQINRKPRQKRLAGNLLKIIQTAVENIVSTRIAAQSINRAVAS